VKQIHKEYEHPFLLEPTKLTRILDRIHERLDEHKDTTKRDHFEVFMRGGRSEEMAKAEDVLALENSRRYKIERLLIVCSATTEGSTRPEHEVQVDYGVPKARLPTVTAGKMITVSVRSDAAGWASRTLSDIEEQVERTWLRHTGILLALLGLTLCALGVFASQFVRLQPQRHIATVHWLQSTDIDRVGQMLSSGRTLTDEEVREVTTMQLRNVVLDQGPEEPPPKGQARKLVLFGIPLLLVVGCSLTLLATGYPQVVFLWGDEIERHANRLQRRRVIWGIIVSLLVVGVLSKLFYEGVASWIPGG
jgi:hypothetical protein